MLEDTPTKPSIDTEVAMEVDAIISSLKVSTQDGNVSLA